MRNPALIAWLAKQAAVTSRSRVVPAKDAESVAKALKEEPPTASQAATRYGRKPYLRGP